MLVLFLLASTLFREALTRLEQIVLLFCHFPAKSLLWRPGQWIGRMAKTVFMRQQAVSILTTVLFCVMLYL